MLRRPARACLLAIAACHHTPPHKPGDAWLKSVEFEGNHALSRSALLDGLALHRTEKEGREPDPYQVELDTQRVRSQYVREGFFAADVQGRVERKHDATTVVYSIQEGARAGTSVTIRGLPNDPAVTAQQVRAKLPLADGAPFDYDIYDAAKAPLLGVVQDAGYAHARLDANVWGDVATHTAAIELVFTPGPKCKFGTVTIEGVQGALRDAIVHRLQFAPGDPYSSHAVTATQRELYAMNRFSSVQVQPDPGDGETVDMKVTVSEIASHEVTFGAGFGADPISYEVRGRAGYSVTGWPTQLDTVTLDLQPAYAYLRDGSGYEPRMRALARLDRQDLWLPYAKGSVEVGYDYLAYEAWTQYGPEARVGYEVRLGTPHVKLHVGYLFHDYNFLRPNALIDPALQMQIGIDHSGARRRLHAVGDRRLSRSSGRAASRGLRGDQGG